MGLIPAIKSSIHKCWASIAERGGDEKEMNDGGVQAKLMANCQPLAVCVCVCACSCVSVGTLFIMTYSTLINYWLSS